MADGQLGGNSPYLQGKPCPKCGHVRTPADTNPAWQCPRCHIAYLKFQPGAPLRMRLVAGGRELAAEGASDRSVYALIAANVFAAAVAVVFRMDLRDLMMVYWAQSVIIGLSFFVRILSLREFSTEGTKGWEEGTNLQETALVKLLAAFIFLAHYGAIHGYLLQFITSDRFFGGEAPHLSLGFWLGALAFALNHAYSLAHNIRRDRLGRPNLVTLMFLPYARIFPMHFIILFGSYFFFEGTGAFALFCALKVAADVVMHTVEHHVLAKGSVLPLTIGSDDQSQR